MIAALHRAPPGAGVDYMDFEAQGDLEGIGEAGQEHGQEEADEWEDHDSFEIWE